MDEETKMMMAALQQPAGPVQVVLPPVEAPHRNLSHGETVDKILLFCELQEKLSQAVCLLCQNSVLAMSNKPAATLYCKALYRDLEVCITDCTCFTAV